MSVILSTDKITRTYSNGVVSVPALKETSFSIEQGEFVAIIGRSGSGKSTLLRILGTIDRPDSGKVYIDGIDIFSLKDKELSKLRCEKIGFVYQDYNIFEEFSAYENIIMPFLIDDKEPDKDRVRNIMESLNITHCKDKFPSQMSGGEQQRVSIARALAIEPAVIFADEPTGNLDAENAKEVAMLLGKAARQFNQTIVMVSHDRHMTDFADRIIQIQDGVICESDQPII